MTDQSAAPLPAPESLPLDTTPDAKRRKKKDKLRAAWISFVGRIIAQFVGVAAAIGLGLMLMERHQAASQTTSPQVKRVAVNTAGKRSIAVLPFEDFSGDPQQPSLADAMTEALVTELAKSDALSVISRTSSMYYKGQRKSLPQIAQELKVDVAVEGSVVNAGGRVRITAQLIDASTDEHLWAHSYDRPVGDVLRIQSEIAAAIAQQVSKVLAYRWGPASAFAKSFGGRP
jgi:TolB-like protein